MDLWRPAPCPGHRQSRRSRRREPQTRQSRAPGVRFVRAVAGAPWCTPFLGARQLLAKRPTEPEARSHASACRGTCRPRNGPYLPRDWNSALSIRWRCPRCAGSVDRSARVARSARGCGFRLRPARRWQHGDNQAVESVGHRRRDAWFRRSCRSWCAENNESRDLAETALAHIVAGVEDCIYMRYDLFERRRELTTCGATSCCRMDSQRHLVIIDYSIGMCCNSCLGPYEQGF